MKTHKDFVTNINAIVEGLNFIVPHMWWRNFLQKNQNISDIRQMRVSQSCPLDYLFEVGIIEQSRQSSPNFFDSILRAADSSLKSIKKQLKRVQSIGGEGSRGKRLRIPCQWLQQANLTLKQNCDLLLASPQVKQEIVDLFEFGDESWVIIAPELYRLILAHLQKDSRTQSKKQLMAIPILLSNSHIQNFDRIIQFKNQRYMQIFMKNYSGFSYSFKGYIDHNVSFRNLLKWLDDGMFRLITGSKSKSLFEQRNIVIHLNCTPDLFCYQFYSDQPNQNLNWVNFAEVQNTILGCTTASRIIMFNMGYKIQEIKGASAMLNQNDESYRQLQATHKKRKRDFTPYNSNRMEDQSRMRRAQVLQINPRNEEGRTIQRVNAAVQTADVHSSTQEQTPFDAVAHRNVIIIQGSSQIQTNRIPFPLWKQDLSTDNLIKYGQVRFTIPKIFKPYCDKATIVIKQQGKKIVLPKYCNQLVKNEFGQLMQRQISQPTVDLGDQPPTESVKKQLEMLALQILGIKISQPFEEAEKIEEVDLAKQSSQCEGRTCKNQFMDQFDCEESRQF